MPAAGPTPVEADRRSEGNRRDREVKQDPVQPQPWHVLQLQLVDYVHRGGGDERAEQSCRHGQGDEQGGGKQERHVIRPPRYWPSEDDFKRSALPLAGDAAEWECDGEYRQQSDRNWVDIAQRDRAGQGEHVAAAESHELLQRGKLADDVLHLDTERGVDDRHQHSPAG